MPTVLKLKKDNFYFVVAKDLSPGWSTWYELSIDLGVYMFYK
jgi:hypothetical protein